MTYQQFYSSMLNLKLFIKEQKKLDDVIKVISPTSTGIVEFGNKLIEDYIIVVEIALNDKTESVSWFVFENDFGKKKLQISRGGKFYTIRSEKDLFDFYFAIKP